MDESKESSEDCSLVKSRSDWIVRSWNVRASFAFSLVTGIVAFLWLFTLTGEQLFGIAVGIVTAFFSFWILTIFCMRQFLILLSICLGVIAALLVLSITGWNLFATVVGLVTFAASLSAIVLYKRRAKVSLLFTACVMPAIVAILCWGWLQLAPFRQRSIAYDVVAKTKLQFQSIQSKEEGEWILENQGSVPSWLVKLSGEHATKQVKGLQGKLEHFQSADIYALDLEALDSVYIEKSVDSPELSPQLAEWLFNCPRLSLIHLDLATVSEAELALIEQLGQYERIRNLEIQLNLNHCDDQVDLTRLPREKAYACLTVGELSESRASQLSGMKAVRIETQSISAGAVRKLTGVGHLRFVGCTFDSESASAITEVSSSWLLLDKCKFPNDFEIPSTLSCERHVRRLDLVNTHIQPDLVVQWLSAAKVNRVFLPRPTDKTTEQQLTSQLGTFQDLQSAFISLNAQGAPHLEPIQPKR